MAIASEDTVYIDPERVERTSGGFECQVWIVPAEEGGYTSFCPFLPGAVSEGDTQQEAIKNIREALQGIIRQYLEDGVEIPWLEKPEEGRPADAIEKWIIVDAS